MGLTKQVNKAAEALHVKKREGHMASAGAHRTIPEAEGQAPEISAAAAVHDTAKGPEELGGRVGTRTQPAYAAPGTPLNDPETWEGPKVPPISSRMDAKPAN